MAETKEEKTKAPKEAVLKADKADFEKNKNIAMIAYLIFFLPLLTDAKDSKFAKFHANQGLLLLLFGVIGNIVGGLIPFIGWLLILPAVVILSIVFFIMGLVNASKGEMKELPIFGSIHILDK